MSRRKGTDFRKGQARMVLEAVLRAMAPRMIGRGSLRDVVDELHRDGELWAELELSREPVKVYGTPTSPELAALLTAPIAGHDG